MTISLYSGKVAPSHRAALAALRPSFPNGKEPPKALMDR
jgi:hypothetical protein